MTRVFICHASEDKTAAARPIAASLANLGHSVWFDEYTLQVGDSLRQSINKGLVECDFGVVILSPSFFGRQWPQYELNALHSREMGEGRKLVLPIWHQVSAEFILRVDPGLADRVALHMSDGPDAVAKSIDRAMRERPSHVSSAGTVPKHASTHTGLITIIRERAFSGSGNDYDLTVGGQRKCSLRNGESVTFPVSVGTTTISISYYKANSGGYGRGGDGGPLEGTSGDTEVTVVAGQHLVFRCGYGTASESVKRYGLWRHFTGANALYLRLDK